VRKTGKFVLDNLSSKIDALSENGGYMDNYKTKLQELVQSEGKRVSYKVISESGPEHAKTFEVAAFVDDIEVAVGSGSSKKRAEQEAAKKALKILK